MDTLQENEMDPLTDKLEVRRPSPKFGWQPEGEAVKTESPRIEVGTDRMESNLKVLLEAVQEQMSLQAELDRLEELLSLTAQPQATHDFSEVYISNGPGPSYANYSPSHDHNSNVYSNAFSYNDSTSAALVSGVLSGDHRPLRQPTITEDEVMQLYTEITGSTN